MKRFFIAVLIVFCSLGAAFASGQKTGTIKGKIESDKSKPIAGAQVRAMSSRTRDVKETSTDEAGEYSFELEPDDYTISFDAEGFQGGTLVRMHQVEEGKVTSVKTIKLQKASRSSLIRGAVFDSNGSSLAGARVKLVRVPTAEEARD
ncbi:MAG TPA: carboxypeptidase-like regulatory domain-containing protein, partial [Blastocatellia bacterium]|nr:carboxypeptidase-like regulatory domain-containing protein [Blastocatellia bacterium]